MHRSRFLSLVPFMLMLAPDGTATAGGASPPSAPAPPKPAGTLEEQLTAARNELKTAKDSLSTLTSERDTAVRERDEARHEVTGLTGQFNSATQSATEAQRERDDAKTQLSTVTGERDTARHQLAAAGANVGRLESLCKLQGIDPSKAVPVAPEPAATQSVADFNRRLSEAKTPAARNKVLADFAEASQAGQVARES